MPLLYATWLNVIDKTLLYLSGVKDKKTFLHRKLFACDKLLPKNSNQSNSVNDN